MLDVIRIAEIFHSIQGEGPFTGTPSVFVRTTGCNLRCWFCDTPYTSWTPEGTHTDLPSLLERIRSYECEHVVITGGEPLLQPDVVPLTRALAAEGLFVTVETAGTVCRPVHADLMSISPKLANSTPHGSRWVAAHDRLRENNAVLRQLMAEFPWQLKFVVDAPGDILEIEAFITRHAAPRDRVWLMPQGLSADELQHRLTWLEPEAVRLGCRVSPRLHIELYGNVRGR